MLPGESGYSEHLRKRPARNIPVILSEPGESKDPLLKGTTYLGRSFDSARGLAQDDNQTGAMANPKLMRVRRPAVMGIPNS